jgi:acetate---CoA ligase (ADP-forming)
MAHSLDPLMRPQSVAVIGASDEPARIGGRPVYSMLEGKFQGRLYPVNPSRETVQGLKAYASIKDVPGVVDSVVISVPASVALDVIQECADAGVKSAVVFTSGFAEIGEAGLDAQAEIGRIARESGMRIVGPNCLGVFNLALGWFGTFANTLASRKIPTGPIGIVTQSGAYGGHLFTISQNRGVGTNYWVTTGNEVDVSVAEVIEYYAGLPDIRVIIAYAEGIRDGAQMRQALEAARAAEKPVIFMKVGSTEAGARAAASHTASLAGADAVYDGLFKQYGVYRAETTEEMADIAYACQFGRYPKGPKIGLQTISGGIGVQLADAATKRGFDVKPLPEATQKKILDLIPFAGVNNPVDFTGQVLNERRFLEDSMRYVIDDADYDSHILYMASLPISQFTGALSLEIFTALRDQYPDELMLMSMIGTPEIRKQYEAVGYPCFEDHSLAVRAMAALRYFGEVFERGAPDAPPALPSNALSAPSNAVGEHEAKKIIASAGIPTARETLADSADACVAAWKEFAGPVVMKIASPDLPHKTEIGGVLLNIDGEEAVREGHATLLERARAAKPDARIDGVIVAEMIKGGVETVIGVVRDPVFGPVVMFGIGGVFVEVLKDITFRVAPFGVDEAYRMINEIRGRAMLDGVRGAPASDIGALADALSRLSVFAAANTETIDSIDVNPFIVLPKGAAAVDALIVPSEGG